MDIISPIISRVAHLFQWQPQARLYHYTDLCAAQGIAESMALWATDARFLNDTSEILQFITCMRRCLKSTEIETKFNSQIIAQLLHWLDVRFSNNIITPMVFIASLSEQGDLLSQWRGYTSKSQGVSLGFQPRDLSNTAKKNKLLFGKCIYAPDVHHQIAEEACKFLLQEAMNEGACTTAHPTQDYFHVFHRFEQEILAIAALIKHKAYAEEAEWRFVARSIYSYDTPAIKYRASNEYLIPYIEIDLSEPSTAKLPTLEVIVGPSATSPLNMVSVSHFFSHRSPSLHCIKSSIPFRG